MVKRKMLSLTLFVAMLFSLFVPMQAFASDYNPDEGYEITESGVSIDTIDKLMEERTNAILEEDTNAVESINDELDELGVKKISLQEVIELSGDEISPIMTRATSNITFDTVNSTYTVGGTSYKVMRIYATPTGSTSCLYKTGVTTLTNSKSATAAAMKFFTSAASSAAGFASNTIAKAQAVYDALSGAISTLKTTSTITDIKATYTWNSAETCAFIYFMNPSTNAYILKGRYSKANFGVGVSVPTLSVNGKDVIASVKQKSYSGKADPNGYNNISQAFLKFKNGGIHIAQINSITIKGIESKSVKTINLHNPQEPAEIY